MGGTAGGSPKDQCLGEERIVKNLNGRPAVAYAITIVLLVFGVALLAQSNRWEKTPAYGNLLRILPADAWGFVYLGAALLMIVALVFWEHRLTAIIGHMVAFGVLVFWEGGFIIRYLTDSATTVVNVVSWAVYLFLVVSSAREIDRPVKI